MAYISETQQVVMKVELGRVLADSSLIKGIISRDQRSKEKLEMKDGTNYYEKKHKILDHNFKRFYDGNVWKEVTDAADNRIPKAWHNLLVDQKTDYIVGNPISFKVKDSDQNEKQKEFEQLITDELDIYFGEVASEWIIGASNKGLEWIHPFVNSKGEFDYVIISAEQIIPDYDDQTKTNLISVMRYYPVDYMDTDNNLKQKIRVEIWDAYKVSFYIEDPRTGNFYFDTEIGENPRPHWKEYMSTDSENKEGRSWERVPFIPLFNNSKKINDLRGIKAMIDSYDMISSKLSNDIEDIQEVIFNLKDYEGTDLAEFRRNVKIFKAIKTSGEGGVEKIEVSIPIEAVKGAMQALKRDIYLIGQGVDMSDDNFAGQFTGVALKHKFAGLDLKANKMITQLKLALREFMWFLVEDINNRQKSSYDYLQVQFVINKSLINNETEIIQNLNASRDIMSKRAIMAKHPYIDNVQQNIDELEEEVQSIDLGDEEDDQQ